MRTTGRSLVHRRTVLLSLLLCLILASGTAHPKPPDSSAPLTAPVVLRSMETQGAPDGRSTRVVFHGSLPLSYSATPPGGGEWTLTLEGVDSQGVGREVAVGTPQLERILVRAIPGGRGRPATQIDFQGVSARDRRVRLGGNDLIVELEGIAPPAPTPVEAPNPGYRPARSATAPAPVGAAETPPPRPNDLVVDAGKSMTLSLESPANRVSVANPSVADAVVISPQQLLINGIAPGNTSLVIWFRSGESRNYSLTVQLDTASLEQQLRQLFPQEDIAVTASKETLVLHGSVSKPEIGEKAAKIASDYSPKVVNNLSYRGTGRRQILLKVMFAEVNREAITELSASFVRIDPRNPRGDHEGMGTAGRPVSGGKFIDPQNIGPDFTFNDAINIYAFNFRDKIAGFVTALKTRGLLQVLAEPTLITADGQKASFLAGGEFPIPVAQAGAGFTSVTIIFKKFGISLEFTPEIRSDGTIVLKVEPEVSSLDFANAVVLSGFTIPSLKVRRASTEVELKDGQSFAIAGLYSADLQQTKKKIPLLGDVPLLGYLFRSKTLTKNKSELLVIATPILVEPLDPGQKTTLPQFDMSFDIEKKPKREKPVDQEADEPATRTRP